MPNLDFNSLQEAQQFYLNTVATNPEFSTLPYNDQVLTRRNIFLKALPKDTEFNALPPTDRALIFQNLLFQEPILEKAENATQMKQVVSDYKAGKQNWQDNLFNIALKTAANLGPIGIVGSLTDTKAISNPLLDAILGKSGMSYVPSAMIVKNAINSFGDNSMLVGLGKQAVAGVVGLANKEAGGDLQKNYRDTTKQVEYYSYLLNQDKRFSTASQITSSVAGFGGMALDFYVMYKGLTGTLQSPAGLTKPLTKAVDLLTNNIQSGALANWVGRAGTAISHAAVGGVINATREVIMDSLKNLNDDGQFRINLTNAATYFGQGFMGDLAMFGVGGFLKNLLVPMVKKGFFPSLKDLKEVKHPKEIRAIQNAIEGVPVDQATYSRLDPKQKSIIDHMEAFHKVSSNVEVPDKLALTKSIALSKNLLIDFNKEKNVWTLNRALDLDDGFKPIESADFDDITRKMIETVASPGPTAKQATKQVGSMAAGLGSKIELREKITKTLNVDNLTADKLVNIIAPRGGELTAPQISGFMRSLSNGEKVIVTPKTNGFDVQVGGRTVYSDLPKKFSSPEEEKQVLSKLIENTNAKPETVKGFIDTYSENLSRKKIFTPVWIESLVKEHPNYTGISKTGNTWNLLKTDGTAIPFDSFEKLGAQVVGSSTKTTILSHHLAHEGMRLKVPYKEGEVYQVWKGKNLVATGKDIPEILTSRPELAPKIDSFYGPEITAIDDTAEQLTYQGKVLTGKVPDVLNQLAKFSDDPSRSSKVKLQTEGSSELNYNKLTKLYEIYIPEINHRQTFNNVNEAKKFLKDGIKDYSFLYETALQKGFRLVPYNGQWAIYTQGTKNGAYIANSVEELKKILKTVEMPEWANELSGLAATELATLKPQPGFIYKAASTTFDRTVDMPLSWYLNNLIRPPDASLYAAFKKGMPKELYEGFLKIEEARRITNSHLAQVMPGVEQAFTDGVTGKLITDESVLSLIDEVVETAEDRWADVAKAKGLDSKYLDNVRALRTAYDSLGELAGIEKGQWLQNYSWHLKKNLDLKNLTDDADPVGFLRKTWGQDNLPKSIAETYKHSRSSEVAQFLMERNALIKLRKYATTAVRAKWMNPVLDELKANMKKSFGKIDNGLFRQFAGYLDAVTGMPRHWGEKDLMDITQKMYSSLGLKNSERFSKDFTRYIMGLGYASSMGFRPGLAIRNGFQIFQTLAPRIGNSWVNEGIAAVHADKLGSIYQRLIKKNVIQADIPLGGGEMFGDKDILSKAVKHGLSWYQNLDEYTRAVSYVSAEKRFSDALKRKDRFKWNVGKFTDESGLYLLDDIQQEHIGSLIRQGKLDAATDLFASTIVDETMFKYGKAMSPAIANRGIIGRLFGQMGQYSFWYVENVRRGLSRGTTAQKLGFATRWIGNSMALVGAFSALGIKADSFLPHQPALFGGGPFYNILTDIIRSVGPGYEGSQARASLYGLKEKDGAPYWDYSAFLKSDLVRSLQPFGVQASYVDKAIKYFSEGDYYKGWLAATSFTPST